MHAWYFHSAMNATQHINPDLPNDVVHHGQDRESRELEEAAQRLTALEAAPASIHSDWLRLDNNDAQWGEFDEKRFLAEPTTQQRDMPMGS